MADGEHNKPTSPSWYRSKCYNWSLISQNFVALLLYILIIVYALKFKNLVEPLLSQQSVYTQGLDEWTNKSWDSFTWSPDGECPSGYEPIGVTWEGTLPYNVTEYGFDVELAELSGETPRYEA